MSWSLELFGCDVDQLPVGGSTVADMRREAVAVAHDLGLQLQVGPRTVASAGFVQALCDGATQAGTAVRAAVAIADIHAEFGANVFGDVEPIDGTLRYELTACRPGSTAARPASETATIDSTGLPTPAPVLIEQLAVASRSPQPGRMAQPITGFAGDRFIWSIGHWYDLLVANLLAVQSHTAAIDGNTIAESASVDPTAVIKNSVIAEGAVVGPYAVVRNSELGAGTVVEEQTSIRGSLIAENSIVQAQSMVHGSVVGPGTVISFHTAVRGSVLFGHSTISAPVVARSVIGPETFLGRGASISATTLVDSAIVVRHGSRRVATGARLLGCAVGRGARIGNGLTIPPGYTVPAGTYMTERPIPQVSPDTPTDTPLLLDNGKFRSIPTLKGPRS